MIKTAQNIAAIRKLLKAQGMEMHGPSKRGQMKVGARRVYHFWCNTTTTSVQSGAVIIVRRTTTTFVYRVVND